MPLDWMTAWGMAWGHTQASKRVAQPTVVVSSLPQSLGVLPVCRGQPPGGCQKKASTVKTFSIHLYGVDASAQGLWKSDFFTDDPTFRHSPRGQTPGGPIWPTSPSLGPSSCSLEDGVVHTTLWGFLPSHQQWSPAFWDPTAFLHLGPTPSSNF